MKEKLKELVQKWKKYADITYDDQEYTVYTNCSEQLEDVIKEYLD